MPLYKLTNNVLPKLMSKLASFEFVCDYIKSEYSEDGYIIHNDHIEDIIYGVIVSSDDLAFEIDQIMP